LSPPLRFSHQNPARISPLLHTCHMYCPSQSLVFSILLPEQCLFRNTKHEAPR
jgi:hypothetical protein